MKALSRKNIDLYYKLNHQEKRKEDKHTTRNLMVICAVGLFLILALLLGRSVLKTLSLKAKIAMVQAEIDFMTQQDEQVKLARLERRMVELREYNNNYESVVAYLETLPKVDRPLFEDIKKSTEGKVEISNISYDETGISLQCLVFDYNEGPLFVQRLKQVPAISDVSYTGFNHTEVESEVIENGISYNRNVDAYAFSVFLTLNNDNGGEE